MKTVLPRWVLLAFCCGLAMGALGFAQRSAFAQRYAGDPAGAKENEREPLVWKYKFQKRGGGVGAFEGWFMDVDKSAKPEKGIVAALTSTWTDKEDSTTWEVRAAGEFNGVDCVYVVWAGNGDFHGWYLGLNEESGQLSLLDSAKSSTTKWLINYSGTAQEHDLYTIRNAGLSKLTGLFVAMSEQGDHRTGTARNVGLFNNPRDPRVMWSLKRLPQPVEDREVRR